MNIRAIVAKNANNTVVRIFEMNFVEAMKAMLDGKKIQSTLWGSREYIFLKDGKIYDELNKLTQAEVSLKDQYLVYQEPQEQLFQWVFKIKDGIWTVCHELLTENQAKKEFQNYEYKKLSEVLGEK